MSYFSACEEALQGYWLCFRYYQKGYKPYTDLRTFFIHERFVEIGNKKRKLSTVEEFKLTFMRFAVADFGGYSSASAVVRVDAGCWEDDQV